MILQEIDFMIDQVRKDEKSQLAEIARNTRQKRDKLRSENARLLEALEVKE